MKKNLFTGMLFFLISSSLWAQKQTKQCKYYIFSCPPGTAKICNNSNLYKELEASRDGFGMYEKDKRGCWVVRKSKIDAGDNKTLEWIRKLFGSKSLKPQT